MRYFHGISAMRQSVRRSIFVGMGIQWCHGGHVLFYLPIYPPEVVCF